MYKIMYLLVRTSRLRNEISCLEMRGVPWPVQASGPVDGEQTGHESIQ